MDRGIHVINGLLALALIGFSVWTWSELPERVPGQFGLGTEPTRWADRSILSWFGLPIIGLLTTGAVYFGAYAITRWPVTLNVPDKRRFLALTPAQQAPIIAINRQLLYFVATQLLVLFVIAQLGMWAAANGEPHQVYTVTVLVLAIAMGPFTLIVWMPRIQRAMRNAEAS